MNKYQQNKARVRQLAIEYQQQAGETPMTWGECAYWGNKFTNLGRRYGLLREFHENGIC